MKNRLPIPLLARRVVVCCRLLGHANQASAGNAATTIPTPANDIMSMGMAAPNPSDSPASQGYKKSMDDMMANMPTFTGEADVDFMRQMKVHHGSAIAIAQTELRYGGDPRARALT